MAETDEQPVGILGQFRTLWGKMSQRQRSAFMFAALATVALVAYLATASGRVEYDTLFSGLEPADAGDVVEKLKAKKIPFRVRSGGTVIEVPKSRVHEVRISMAASGYPKGGSTGFEIFDEQSFGTTSFVEQINYRRALQGELVRTIVALDSVESARVHIALGKQSIFREADKPASASITVKIARNKKLSADQIRGIVHLVSSSVDGLEADRVVIIDDKGGVLTTGQDEQDIEAQSKLESELASRIKKMLERYMGKDHVAVVVTAQMDHTRMEQTEELFEQDKDKVAMRNEVRTAEGQGQIATAGGLDGVASDPANPNRQGKANKVSETRNYEINKVVRHTVGEKAKLKQLHVALLVDYKRDEAAILAAKKEAEEKAAAEAEADKKKKGKKKKDEEEKQVEPEPVEIPMLARSAEELEEIKKIAIQAAGLDLVPESQGGRGDTIEIQSVPFQQSEKADVVESIAPSEPAAFLPMSMIAAIIGGLLLVIIAVSVLRVNAGRRAARPEILSLPAVVTEVERALDPAMLAQGSALAEMENRRHQLMAAEPDQTLNDRVAQAVQADTVRAAHVISSLLSEGKH